MNQRYAVAQPAPSVLATNKLIRNTYILLSLTLLFSAMTAGISIVLNFPSMGLLITLGGYFGLLYLTSALRNSAWGLAAVFALTGFMGLTLGPFLNAYMQYFSNGGQLVMLALGGTGVIFLGLSGYALSTRKDFSFMGGFLMVGILVAFLMGICAVHIQHTGHGAGRVGHIHPVDVRPDPVPDQCDDPRWRNQLHHGHNHPVRRHL